jgi:hypothetical protein
MKDPQDTDLIKQVKKVLDEYEEPYLEGSWEHFSESQKSVSFFAWRWALAAAVVLIIGSIWIFSRDVSIDKTSSRIVRNHIPDLPSAKKLAPRPNDSGDPVLSAAAPRFATRLPVQEKPIDPSDTIALSIATLGPIEGLSNRIAMVSPQLNAASKEGMSSGNDNRDNSTARIMDFLTAQSAKNNSAKPKLDRSSNWDFGVEILPTMSNAAVNVGAGLTAELRISKHFAVGSGISMVGLQAGKSLTPGVSLLSTKQLQAVDANLTGIDIPLNIVYKVNKNLYTSLGVSYFNVVQERRSNTYVSERQISEASMDAVTGLESNIRTFVSETTQEPATETILNGKSYLGFFNMSIGRKQQISKFNIYIEPFVKLPIGKLSQQELKLTNGGMKFRVSF